MKTNLEKFNHYLDIVTERSNKYIKSQIEVIPEKMYVVYPIGTLHELEITGVRYEPRENNRYFTLAFFTKKPSNESVENIKLYAEMSIEFVKEKILFDYKEKGDGYTSSGCFHPFGKNDARKYFFTIEEAEAVSKIVAEENRVRQEFKELHKKDASYNYLMNGYKFLGWQNGWKHVYYDKDGNITNDPTKRASFGYDKANYPEYGNCNELKHQIIEVFHNGRGSENTVSCPICKIYWKYDCSD